MNRRDFLYASSAILMTPLIGRGQSKNTVPKVENLISQTAKKKITIPPEGKFYHGFHPGRPADASTGREDDFIEQDVIDYEGKTLGVDKKAAFIYFSNNWNREREVIEFPQTMCKMIDARSSIPFIRLMLRSTEETNSLELECKKGRYEEKSKDHKMKELSLDKILKDKELRKQLKAWGKVAKDFNKPIIVEWGTEVNGSWFEWNGYWNGQAEGARKFRQTYEYIRHQIEDEGGADNITWAFHVTASDDPTNDDSDCAKDMSLDWNKFENYYPGNFIDIFGVSIYGAQKPTDTECTPFVKQMQDVYNRFQRIDSDKPIFVLEFGATNNSDGCGNASSNCEDTASNGAAKWADDALQAIFTNSDWKMLRGFCWWNEAWQEVEEKKVNGKKVKIIHKTNMRVQDNECLKKVFQKHLSEYTDKILTNLIIK